MMPKVALCFKHCSVAVVNDASLSLLSVLTTYYCQFNPLSNLYVPGRADCYLRVVIGGFKGTRGNRCKKTFKFSASEST